MRLVANTLAYNDEGVITGTIKCLAPYVDRHVVLISEEPYFGEPSAPDCTEEICMIHDVEIIKGTWPLDHFQRNVGVVVSQDADWIITFDSDEMMTHEQMENFIKFLEKTDAQAVCLKPEVYWKTTDYRLRPIPDYAPVLAVRPSVRFTYIRNINTPFALFDEGGMHHLSWCAPKDIYKKVIHYAHATDFNGHEWYKEKYCMWNPLQPAELPTATYDVIKKPLPQELKEYLNG